MPPSKGWIGMGSPIASVEVGTKGNVAVPDAFQRGSYKAEMKVMVGGRESAPVCNAGKADAAGKRTCIPRWTAARFTGCPEQRSRNVEPVINVKPAEDGAE